MMRTILILLGLLTATVAVSACVPLAVGAGGAVVADQIAEDQNGDDGLF